MGHWMFFLLGCWVGCIAGFLLTGLASASKFEERSPELNNGRTTPSMLSPALAEEASS